MTYIDPRLKNKTIEQYQMEIRALRRRNYELAEELEKFEKQTKREARVLVFLCFTYIPYILFRIATR